MGLSKKILSIFVVIGIIVSLSACSFISYVGGNGSGSGGSSETNSQAKSSAASENEGLYDKREISGSIDIHVIETPSTSGGLTEVLDTIRHSVVEIYSNTSNGTSAGSGVVVDLKDTDNVNGYDLAYIITCHHVIDSARYTSVKTLEGVEYEASLIGSDPNSDIGLIVIEAEEGKNLNDLKYASWYNSDDLKVGMDVVAIGNPLGTLGGTVTKGIISAINRDMLIEGKTMKMLLQTDAAINGGNSGGGLFDVGTGALVGIVNAGYAAYAADGINFAIPSNTARQVEQALASTYDSGSTFGYVEGSYDFGVEFSLTYTTSGRSRYYYPYISSIDYYGTFHKGGLNVNDIIYSITIGDETLDMSAGLSSNLQSLNAFLSKEYSVGENVSVTYGRYSGSSLRKSTVEFKIFQYVYGQ